MKLPIGRIASAAMALQLAASGAAPLCAFGAENTVSAALTADYYSIEPFDSGLLTFSEYYDKYSGENRPDKEIILDKSDISAVENGDITTGSFTSDDGETRNNVILWNSADGSIVFGLDVKETGNYCISADYCPMLSGSPDIELKMEIDGKLPYDTASRMTLSRVWTDEHEIYTDIRGNQVRPAQVQRPVWKSSVFGDIDGLFSEPLFIYLEKGKHELRFSSERAQLAIERIKLFNPEELPAYSEYAASAATEQTIGGTPSALFRIEGESALYKSDPTLYPTYDNSSYLASPADPRKMVYNTLGSGSWKKALQTVTWEIPEEDIGSGGWYKIGIKARQDQIRGFDSNRRIYIDGKVPCRELDRVEFAYDTDWSVVTPESGGDYVYVWLEGGMPHTISLEAVTGDIGEYLRRLEGVVRELNTYYRKVLMITGPSPDKYTDYYVHEKIPGLVERFGSISAELKDVQSGIEALAGSKGTEAAALENMAVILDKCTEKPLRIPSYLSQIKDSITSLSAWMRDNRDQPLEIDYIEFATADREFSSCDEKLGKSLKFGLDAFIGSFFEDYTTLSDVENEEAMEVWVSLGRDQAQVVKEMTENRFMQETGIPVSVNLVTGGVVEASLAGKGPDVALFLGGEFPVNLAARDLLVDLSQFDDFGEVRERFQRNAMTQYTYNGGCYGLPLSQSFPMMFYRTDVLTELGYFSPPETWSELRDMLPALQRNYMSVGLVLPPNNISPATEAGHTFAMLLLQKGKTYYNEDLTASSLDTIEAVQSFEEWTDFYTDYCFEQTYDAFSRFRTGEYPIVIANYTFFNQLTAASPEIKGLWDFCPVPGTERADGTVSHAANSNGAGAVIFSKVKNKENAWEFVKWFTDTETQVQYASQIEGLLGTLGRFDTANVEALGRMSWSNGELERLRAQQAELEEIPVTPASYAVTRNIMNAFRETINEHNNPRDTLIWYNKDINDEITRKRKNLGLN
ncbi:extracellular solute-binding protein [Ruminococcus sp.]|uniref:extracellular solute-binding protein n=1 Tax=Ruminococcus sp. TaxID=41978 RepID=UPI00260144D8|nr:extracellular solute-binding protein [Ruminococcus sp.]